MKRVITTAALLVAALGLPGAASGVTESAASPATSTATGLVAAGSEAASYAGAGDRIDADEFLRENRAVEEAMNEAALACMQRSGALHGYASAAEAFGGYVGGERVEGSAAGQVSERCASEAFEAGMRHVDPGLEVSVSAATPVTEDSTSGATGEAGEGEVGALGGDCPNPSTAMQWIYGQTGPPRWIGMNELVFLGLNNFLNNWRAYQKPCYHVWTSDGCSVPDGMAAEPAFKGSCYRHDWGYRSIQKGDGIYTKDLWILLNKAAADTRFLYDMRAKCDSMNLSSFERDRCRDKAGVYYTAVAKFYRSDYYEGYDTYNVLQEGFVLP